MSVLLDTGPLVALLSRRDQHKEWATAQMATLEPPFYSCEAVLSEAVFLLQDSAAAMRGLVALLNRRVIDFSFSFGSDQERVTELLLKYHPMMEFADACLVAMAEQRPGSFVFTTDTRHFSIYRQHDDRPLSLIAPVPSA